MCTYLLLWFLYKRGSFIQLCHGYCRFFVGVWNMKGFLSEDRPVQTLRTVLQRLQDTYCGTIGYEVQCDWMILLTQGTDAGCHPIDV